MTTLHPTTVALLEAARAFADAPVSNDERETKRLQNAAVDWWREADCPDLTTPTPDRLTELEERIKTLFKLAGNRRPDSDDQLAQVTELEARLGALTGRVAALERAQAPQPAPEPPPFIPTEPGWYWREGVRPPVDGNRVSEVVRLNGALWCMGSPVWEFRWLAPVIPYEEGLRLRALQEAHTPREVEPSPAVVVRTEEEARKEPRRGDRWKGDDYEYTLTRHWLGGQWYAIENGRETRGLLPGGFRLNDETYLGNFAHELDP